jgi:hypothetical protein
MRPGRNRNPSLYLPAIAAISTALGCNRSTHGDASVADGASDDATLEDVSADIAPSVDAAPRRPS